MSTPRAPSSRSGAAEARLFDRYARDGDVAARDALVDLYLPLARHLAWRFGRGSAHAEDLVQVASLGLLKAIERFDPSRGLAFSSFATPTIVGELKRYFRDKGWAVRVPRELQERAVRVRRCADELESELGRPPPPHSWPSGSGATIEEVLEAREAGDAQHGLSFSRPSREADDGDEQTLGDRLGAEDHALSGAEDTVTIEGLMSHLDDRERAILRLRFHDDLTQSEIGQRIGISQMHVSRLLRQAITRLQILAQEGDRPAA